ncbi:hypothetical protein [Methanosarcina horonobensis]|uniref:hypothetical protein n=1 Tax=Methanosarcina horonobensis TaxID=418008 RepID=UPI0022B87150|nr:hypothetical protein [Methanosarcina horonobensis]
MTIRGISDSGEEIPTKGNKKFISTPKNIKKHKLKPVEYKMTSIKLNLFNLSVSRIKNPGINVRYMKPISCLRTGIFKFNKSNPTVPRKAN